MFTLKSGFVTFLFPVSYSSTMLQRLLEKNYQHARTLELAQRRAESYKSHASYLALATLSADLNIVSLAADYVTESSRKVQEEANSLLSTPTSFPKVSFCLLTCLYSVADASTLNNTAAVDGRKC